jgi:hypothetical protein
MEIIIIMLAVAVVELPLIIPQEMVVSVAVAAEVLHLLRTLQLLV